MLQSAQFFCGLFEVYLRLRQLLLLLLQFLLQNWHERQFSVLLRHVLQPLNSHLHICYLRADLLIHYFLGIDSLLKDLLPVFRLLVDAAHRWVLQFASLCPHSLVNLVFLHDQLLQLLLFLDELGDPLIL